MKNKLGKFRRLIILGLTLLSAILAVVFGSIFYVSKNSKKSIEYSGGAEYVVKIVVPNDNNGHSAKNISTDVADSIYERLNPDGLANITVETEYSEKITSVRVRYSGISTQAEKDRIQKLITTKPHLVFTDSAGRSIFDSHSRFRLNTDYKNAVTPILSGATKAVLENGQWKVQVVLDSDVAAQEFTSATAALAASHSPIFTWLDISSFISEMKKYPTYDNPNPVVAAHDGSKAQSIRKYYPFDASQYLISEASVSRPLSGRVFVIEGNFSHDEAASLARKINYGASNYSLKITSSNFIDASYGTHSFDNAIIAGLVVFSVIALFLIVNYGLLGVLSTISIGLYTFLTLMMFTVMRGEYSPESIAALILGLGMSVDANIITFERLKTEVYSGSTLTKANKTANQRSLTTIFDANITTLIVAFVLFFFGTRNVKGLSVTLIISIFFTLVIMLGFTRLTSTLLVKTGMFDKRKWMLGMKPRVDGYVQKSLNKFNYVKHSRWFLIFSLLILVGGIVVFSVMAGIAGSISGGFNLSQEFSGGTIGELQLKETGGKSIDANQQLAIIKVFTSKGVHPSDIHKIFDADHSKVIGMQIKTNYDINLDAIIKDNTINTYNFTHASTSNEVATTLVKNAMIAISIAIGLIIVYTLIRFRWTYSLAAIFALVHDGLILTAIFVIARLQISPIFIAGLLSILGYSINDTIVTFDRIREKMHAYSGKLDKSKITSIANEAIKDTIKRSLLTSFTTMIAVIVLMSFGNATKFEFNIAMIIGLFFGTYSSIFIASWLWVKLEIFRLKRKEIREKNNFWKTDDIEEEVVIGINDFSA